MDSTVSVSNEPQITMSVDDTGIPPDTTSEVDETQRRLVDTPSTDPDETPTELEKDYGPDDLLSVLKPVTICMILIIIIVKSIPTYSQISEQLIYTPLSEKDSSNNVIVSNVFLNSLIFTSFVVVMTVVLVVLYVKKFYKVHPGLIKVINCWLMGSTCLILFFFTYDFAWNFCRHFRVPVDIATAVLFTWNVGALGVVHIHLDNSSPIIIQQIYLIYISILSALLFIRYLPEWTTWAVLGALAVWDLIAVLCPRGPLRVLVETAQSRSEQIMPALIYSTMAQPEDQSEESSGPKLGLGDFIFYSILVGRSSSSADILTVVFCIVSILVGLIFTLGLLVLANRALPALPISITLAVIIFFTVFYTTSPFADKLVINSLFI